MPTRVHRILLTLGALSLPALLAAQQPLTLGDAARLAAGNNAGAVVARERAVQSGARSMQYRAALLPSLQTDATVDGGTDDPLGVALGGNGLSSLRFERALDMRVRLTQPLLDMASMGRWKASSTDADAAGLSALHAQDRAARDGALAYVEVLRAEASLAARVADSALAWELLDMARKQLAAGTAIALDVTRAESQLAAATSALIKARNARARTALELQRVLDLPLGGAVVLADSLREPAAGDAATGAAEAVQGALARRGDVLSAETSQRAAHQWVASAKRERLPVISAFAQAGSNADGTLDSHTYGLMVSVPIFDGLKREARIAEGRAREREAAAQLDDTRRRAEVEVRSALLDLEAAREQVAAAHVQLGLAEREVHQARERFRNEVAGNADVINAQLALNAARDVEVDALASYHAARVALASAQGLTTTLP